MSVYNLSISDPETSPLEAPQESLSALDLQTLNIRMRSMGRVQVYGAKKTLKVTGRLWYFTPTQRISSENYCVEISGEKGEGRV